MITIELIFNHASTFGEKIPENTFLIMRSRFSINHYLE